MKRNTYTIALYGVMSALMFVAMFLETYVFSILIPIAPPCFLSLTIAITLCLVGEWKGMFVGGTIMGVCSFLMAIIIANPAFIYPWISILPRIFIGVSAFFMCKLASMLTKNCKSDFMKKYFPYGLGAIFGVLTNTVLTLTMLYLCSFIGIEGIIGTFMAINFPVEIVACAILVPILVNAVKRYRGE